MSPIEIESGTFDNWTALFNSKFLNSGKFEKLPDSTKEQTELEVFRRKGEAGEHLTSIEAGYLGDRLFYLYISNPKIPGYMKFQEGEYFNQHDFTEAEGRGEPGLEFNEVNVQGILNEFKKGLQGRELHYLRGGKILKIELYPFPERPDLSYTYDFEKERHFERFTSFFSKSGKNMETREINLNDIFSGI